MPKFNITGINEKTPSDQEPILNAWYCGFDIDGDGTPRDGILAKWNGSEFVDEDDESVDMNGYEYLVQQV